MKFTMLFSICSAAIFLCLSCTKTTGNGNQGETITQDDESIHIKECSGTHPHYVDLGLPSGTRWACCNLGAKSPEESGDYYAWGETCPKDTFEKENYAYFEQFIKNGTLQEKYEYIGSDISGTIYDAATVHWGSSWQMPTRNQFEELVENCTTKEATCNGVEGCWYIGKNGNGIFIPYHTPAEHHPQRYDCDYPYYWTSTLNTSSTSKYRIGYLFAYDAECRWNCIRPGSNNSVWCPGLIRPVYKTKSSGNNDSGIGSGDINYSEVPTIYLEDYVEYNASRKVCVKFRINSETKITSAQIYGGTSSNATTTLSTSLTGTLSSAYCTGMVSGKCYYFKCTATNKAGTGTSAIYKYYFY